ncbi:hypothetical protein V8E53_008789, partial [Lactarius tabidus]
MHNSFLRAAYSANLTCTSRTRRNMSNLALDAGMLLVPAGHFIFSPCIFYNLCCAWCCVKWNVSSS